MTTVYIKPLVRLYELHDDGTVNRGRWAIDVDGSEQVPVCDTQKGYAIVKAYGEEHAVQLSDLGYLDRQNLSVEFDVVEFDDVDDPWLEGMRQTVPSDDPDENGIVASDFLPWLR